MKTSTLLNIIVFVLLATGFIGYIIMRPMPDIKPVQYISKEKAFEAVKSILNTNSTFNNGARIFDLSFLRSLNKWDDQIDARYQTNTPELISGEDLLKSPTEVGSETIFVSPPNSKSGETYGSPTGLLPEEKYWIFSWLNPGVIDHRYTFYVDAKRGTVHLITYYQSPD